MLIFNELHPTPEFQKDLKKLLKRFPSLDQDLDTFIQTQLNLYHKHNLDNHSIFPIPGLGIDYPKVFKAKKFACKSLKGKGANSGIRIIYAYHEALDRIDLIEIYFKGDHANENKDRITKLYTHSLQPFP